MGFLADGHVLLEDYPGLAKTLLARSFAQVTDLRFQRIQFTPDLMPSDVTGSSIFNQRSGDFEFRAGPIFANLLLGDEINRAPPKTQAALLEARSAGHHRGHTNLLDRPFLVIATNPIEYGARTRRRRSRPLILTSIGYPTAAKREAERRVERKEDEIVLDVVVDRGTLRTCSAPPSIVHVAESVGYYMVDVKATWRARVQVGASSRGSLALPAVALPRCARRALLRHAGRRQVGRRPRPDAPPHAAPEPGCSGLTTSSHRHWRPCRRRPKMYGIDPRPHAEAGRLRVLPRLV
jgi:MoxR-like ATPase